MDTADVDNFLKELQVVIVHGGSGERLKHRTGDTPKSLLVVYNGEPEGNERTLLDYELELWHGFCPDITILLGEPTQSVARYIEERHPNLGVRYSISRQDLGKGGIIGQAMLDGLIDQTRPIVVTFPDDLKLDRDLPYTVALMHLDGISRGCLATDILVEGAEYQYGRSEVERRGYVRTRSGLEIPVGTVVSREEKPIIREPTSIGVYVFDPKTYPMFISEQPPYRFEDTVLAKLYSKGKLNCGILSIGVWIPVNDDNGYAAARRELTRRNGII